MLIIANTFRHLEAPGQELRPVVRNDLGAAN